MNRGAMKRDIEHSRIEKMIREGLESCVIRERTGVSYSTIRLIRKGMEDDVHGAAEGK